MKLHAVMGPSMGGLQTFEWAATYPEAMERIIPAIASATPSAWLIAWLEAWAAPIRLDLNWNGKVIRLELPSSTWSNATWQNLAPPR